MSEIVNLRRARKDRARKKAAADADANRVQFGRTKAEKSATHIENARAAKHLDAHKRDQDDA